MGGLSLSTGRVATPRRIGAEEVLGELVTSQSSAQLEGSMMCVEEIQGDRKLLDTQLGRAGTTTRDWRSLSAVCLTGSASLIQLIVGYR